MSSYFIGRPKLKFQFRGKQVESELSAPSNITSSQICNICSHFSFGMICGSVLDLKEECVSDEDAASWAWEAYGGKGFEEKAFQLAMQRLRSP